MEIKPKGACIFVLPDKIEEVSKGGIILSDYSKKRPTSGTIISVGDKAINFTPGQRIIYGEFSGNKQIINHKGEDTEIFLMTEEDILATLEEK